LDSDHTDPIAVDDLIVTGGDLTHGAPPASTSSSSPREAALEAAGLRVEEGSVLISGLADLLLAQPRNQRIKT